MRRIKAGGTNGWALAMARRMPALASPSGSRLPAKLKPEARSSKQGKQEANDSSEESRLRLPSGSGIQHALLVQAEGLGGDHRTQATLSPGGNRRARDLDVPGDRLGAAANDLFAEAMVIGAASSGCA